MAKVTSLFDAEQAVKNARNSLSAAKREKLPKSEIAKFEKDLKNRVAALNTVKKALDSLNGTC